MPQYRVTIEPEPEGPGCVMWLIIVFIILAAMKACGG